MFEKNYNVFADALAEHLIFRAQFWKEKQSRMNIPAESLKIIEEWDNYQINFINKIDL